MRRRRHQGGGERSSRIVGDPAAIWALVTDINLPARFSDELHTVEWIDGATDVAVGNRFRASNNNDLMGDSQTECEVIEVEPGRRWAYHSKAPTALQRRGDLGSIPAAML